MAMNDQKAAREAGLRIKKVLFSGKVPVKTVRTQYDALFAVASLPNNIDSTEKTIGTVICDQLVPELAVGNRTILYFHGGGFNSGSRLSYRNLCASIAHESASRIILPEYRLAPEHPFPSALEDVYNCYASLLREGTRPGDIIFCGDGSGGGLALSLLDYIESRRVPAPAALVLISPWLDMTLSGETITTLRKRDPVLTKEILMAHAHQYTYRGNFTNPQVSPLFAETRNYPPLFIQCGSEEILLDDACRLADRARKQGSDVTLDVWDGMWHLFQALDAFTPNAHLAVHRLGQWVRGLKTTGKF